MRPIFAAIPAAPLSSFGVAQTTTASSTNSTDVTGSSTGRSPTVITSPTPHSVRTTAPPRSVATDRCGGYAGPAIAGADGTSQRVACVEGATWPPIPERSMRLPTFALLVLATALIVAESRAQLCAPTPPPSGQPALNTFTPACISPLPLAVVWANGNPNFALASFAPAPVPPGLPTFLLIGLQATPTPIPAPPLALIYGAPGFFDQLNLMACPAGLSGPVAGPPVPFPIPPTNGPLGTLNVHTVVLIPGTIVVALTASIDFTI